MGNINKPDNSPEMGSSETRHALSNLTAELHQYPKPQQRREPVDPLRQKESGGVRFERNGRYQGLVYELGARGLIEKKGSTAITALGANDYLQLFSYQYQMYDTDKSKLDRHLSVDPIKKEFQNYYFNQQGLMVAIGYNQAEKTRITPEGTTPILGRFVTISWSMLKNVLGEQSAFYRDAMKRRNEALGAQ